ASSGTPSAGISRAVVPAGPACAGAARTVASQSADGTAARPSSSAVRASSTSPPPWPPSSSGSPTPAQPSAAKRDAKAEPSPASTQPRTAWEGATSASQPRNVFWYAVCSSDSFHCTAAALLTASRGPRDPQPDTLDRLRVLRARQVARVRAEHGRPD